MLSKYIRGMVYYANIPNVIYAPSVQAGRRPVIIVSNDVGNIHSQNVTVVPCTSNISKKDSQPTHYTTRLKKDIDTIVLCEDIMTIDKSCLESFIGVLDDYTMEKISEAIAIALGFTNLKVVPKINTLKAEKETQPVPKQPEKVAEKTTTNAIDRTIKTKAFMKKFLEEMKEYGARHVAKKYGLASDSAAYQRALRYRKALDTK